MKFSRNSFPVDQYLLLWPGLHFTLLFSVQIISGKREREREREREERAQSGERERKKREPAIDEGRDRPMSEKREPTIVDRATSRTIVSISPPISSRAARSHLLLRCAISIWPDLMNFFVGFCFFSLVRRSRQLSLLPLSLSPIWALSSLSLSLSFRKWFELKIRV